MSENGERLQALEFHGNANLDFDSIGFIILSSILASIALLTSSVPVLIGAMILAPAFDPLIAIPFGILNKDWGLVRQGITSSAALFAVAFAVAFGITALLLQSTFIPDHPDFERREMVVERLIVGGHSIITAFAAGAGGALAAAANRQSNLVGVVVALALVPSLAAASIGFLDGPLPGWGGLALFGVNVGAIILAGLVILSFRRGTGRAEQELDRRKQ